jgi:hypothetical protein
MKSIFSKPFEQGLILFMGLLLLGFSSCNLEKEVEIDLPDYESQLVLECYLEPGQPFTALLTRSDGYFAPISTSIDNLLEYYQGLLEQDAVVLIRHQGQTYELENSLYFDPNSFRFANYVAKELVPEDYSNPFELEVRTQDGQTIRSSTVLLQPIPIDSVVYEFAEESPDSARILTYFTDNPDEQNFVRRMLHRNTLDSLPDQDFATDDRFVEERVVFGSGYDYGKGERVINTLYHIDEAYYNYLESIFNSISSNGNPFAQPGVILSNLEGTADAIGIFTGLSYDRDTTLIE